MNMRTNRTGRTAEDLAKLLDALLELRAALRARSPSARRRRTAHAILNGAAPAGRLGWHALQMLPPPNSETMEFQRRCRF